MQTKRWVLAATIAAGFTLALSGNAGAEPTKCQRAIAKESSKYAQARSKTLATCEQSKIKGKLAASTDCLTEPKTLDKLTKAAAKLTAAVNKACGGADKLCGGDLTGEDSPASIGWPATCPNFENGACNVAIASCGDIATCLTCIDNAAVNQANDLFHGALVENTVADKPLNKCQQAISRETQKYLAARSKALQGCWDSRLNGKHSGPCPDPANPNPKAPGKKAALAIAKAESKKVAAICKACGGPDKVCGGADDFVPADIGFAAQCPSADIVNQACSDVGSVDTLAEIVECVDCVTDFKTDCMDRSAVPAIAGGYPSDCSPTYGPTCSQLEVTVATSFTPPGGSTVNGITVDLNYNQSRLSMPSDPFNPSVMLARMMNLTGVSGTELAADQNDSVASYGLTAFPGPIPPGNFVEMTFDCVPGKQSPMPGHFGCSSVVSDLEGNELAATCSVVSVNPIP